MAKLDKELKKSLTHAGFWIHDFSLRIKYAPVGSTKCLFKYFPIIIIYLHKKKKCKKRTVLDTNSETLRHEVANFSLINFTLVTRFFNNICLSWMIQQNYILIQYYRHHTNDSCNFFFIQLRIANFFE